MAWTTPLTWAVGQVVSAANLNEQIRDNSNALSTHAHTGAAGDGAQILIPSFENNKRRSLSLPLPPLNIAAGELMVTEALNGAPSAVWNATDKWLTTNWQVTSNGGYCRCYSQHSVSTAQLPEYSLGIAHISTATNIIRAGLADGVLTADPNNGIFFRCTNGGNWFAVTRQNAGGGPETATDTGIAASTTSKEFRFSVDAVGSVTFYINDVLVATITTNIPATTVLLQARAAFITSAAGTFNASVDPFIGLSYRVKSS